MNLDEIAGALRNGPPLPIAPYSVEGGPEGQRKHSFCHGGVHDEDHVCVATATGKTEQQAKEYAEALCAAYNAAPELLAEVRRLRAIVEGSSVPPTPQMLAAHAANGGRWLVRVDAGDGRSFMDFCDEMDAVDHDGGTPVRWIALDRHGLPCEAPVQPSGSVTAELGPIAWVVSRRR